MDKKQCVLCGSLNVSEKVIHEKIHAPLGPEVSYEKKLLVCSDCSFEHEFSEVDKERALVESKRRTAEDILDYLKSSGWSLSAIERALGLPQRTISRWKTDHEPSAAGLALLRILRVYPFVLKLADEKFSEDVARDLILSEAFSMLKVLMKHEFSQELAFCGMHKTINSEKSSVTMYLNFDDNGSSGNQHTSTFTDSDIDIKSIGVK